MAKVGTVQKKKKVTEPGQMIREGPLLQQLKKGCSETESSGAL